MTNGRASGAYEVFADGLPANLTGPQARGARRPTGLAQGPDGALYVSDDATGRIWKVTYAGGK
jgi:glucose/arabinose dehydrogenase